MDLLVKCTLERVSARQKYSFCLADPEPAVLTSQLWSMSPQLCLCLIASCATCKGIAATLLVHGQQRKSDVRSWYVQRLRQAYDQLIGGSAEEMLMVANAAEAAAAGDTTPGSTAAGAESLVRRPRVFTLAIVWETPQVRSWGCLSAGFL